METDRADPQFTEAVPPSLRVARVETRAGDRIKVREPSPGVNLSPETTNGSVGEAENPKNLSPGPISDVDILLSAAAGRFFIPTGCPSVPGFQFAPCPRFAHRGDWTPTVTLVSSLSARARRRRPRSPPPDRADFQVEALIVPAAVFARG